MSIMSGIFEVTANIAKNKAVRGMLLQASRDIFVMRTDRATGYSEFKFANEGDDIEILGPDLDSPCGGFRVINRDNYDQIDTVQCDDLEDTFGDYGK